MPERSRLRRPAWTGRQFAGLAAALAAAGLIGNCLDSGYNLWSDFGPGNRSAPAGSYLVCDLTEDPAGHQTLTLRPGVAGPDRSPASKAGTLRSRP